MADQRITELEALAGVDAATDDLLLLVDVSDTSLAATGTNKQITLDELAVVVAGAAVTAADVSIVDAAADFTATDVEGAIAELQTKLDTHEADALNVHGIEYTGDLALASSVTDHVNDASAAHAATAISYAGGTGISATNVETAIDELATEKADTTSLASYLPLVAAGASVENLGAVESNVNTVASSGSTETLDTSVYAVHDVTMSEACTFTFSNPAPSGKNSTFMLILRGAFTPTFPGSVDWAAATPPTYATPSVYVFTTVDSGTIWLGSLTGSAFG